MTFISYTVYVCMLYYMYKIGAICAERAALVQLRRYENPKILKVIVVTVSYLIFITLYCNNQYYFCYIWNEYIYIYMLYHI